MVLLLAQKTEEDPPPKKPNLTLASQCQPRHVTNLVQVARASLPISPALGQVLWLEVPTVVGASSTPTLCITTRESSA